MDNTKKVKGKMDFIIDERVFDGMDKYKYIMENVKKVNVQTDFAFRKAYCAYYGLNRNTSREFQNEYFAYMEQVKNCSVAYGDVINTLYAKTKRVDYSFASKLLHTIQPDMPILDQHLMRMLGFKLQPNGEAKNRIAYYVKIYETVSAEYAFIQNNLQNGVGKIYQAVKMLQLNFGERCKGIPVAKLLDSLIFRMKDERGPSILEI